VIAVQPQNGREFREAVRVEPRYTTRPTDVLAGERKWQNQSNGACLALGIAGDRLWTDTARSGAVDPVQSKSRAASQSAVHPNAPRRPTPSGDTLPCLAQMARVTTECRDRIAFLRRSSSG